MPFSQTCATLTGPDRTASALNTRWTTPKVSRHGFCVDHPPPFVHVCPFTVPVLLAQLSVTSSGPTVAGTEKNGACPDPFEIQRPDVLSNARSRVTPLMTARSAPTVAWPVVTPKSTSALTPMVQVAVADVK